jgi:tetratricopeptide (TPR) repeat protein
MRIVKLASLLRVPVYPQAFNVLEGVGEITVKGLIDRMLLVEYPDGTCFLHEILKEPIQNKLNPSEIKALSQKALDYFSRKGSDLDLMESLYFSSLAGRSRTFRSYLMRYGEYLASRGYQQVWEMAASLKENELEAEEKVNLFLIGFETALLRDDLPSATDMLSKAKKVCDIEVRSGGGREWNKIMSRVLDRFGELARLEGISEKAIKSYKESLEVMRSTGDSLGEAKALNNLGVAYLDRGELNRAMDFFTDSEKILRAKTDRKGLSYVHINMGNIQRIRGEMKKAGSLFERARLEAESTGAKNLELEAMVKLSELELESGNRDEGIEVLVSCISGYQDINDKRSMWECLERIMVPLMKKGDKKKAIKVLDGVIGQIHRRSRFFHKRSISDLEADDRTIALAITYFKSMVEGEERKARKDLRTYLNWCAVRLSSDAFLDEVKRLDRIAREVKSRVWLDMVYETALPSASLYDEVHPQVILLIKWSRKKYMDEKEKRMLLKKAIRLAREGGFEQGNRKARKLLDSLKIPS